MKWLIRTLPALLHVIVTFQYFRFMIGADENSLGSIINYGFIALTIVNAASTLFVSKGQWRQLVISLVAYVIWFVVWLSVKISIGNPHATDAPDDNPVNGMILLVLGMPISAISLIFGTITGIMIHQLRTQIRLFRE